MAIFGIYLLGAILSLIGLYFWNTAVIGKDKTHEALKINFGWALFVSLFSWVGMILFGLFVLYTLGEHFFNESNIMETLNKMFKGEE